jgi:hypothetical protein
MSIIRNRPLYTSLGLVVLAAACSSSTSVDGSGPNGSGAGGANGASANGGPQFPGAGTSFASKPLSPAAGPETADLCGEDVPSIPGGGVTVIDRGIQCFYGDTPAPSIPAATIEHVVEVLNGQKAIHIRVTFNPNFVDNTYGENAIGWGDDGAEPAPAPPPMGGGKAPKPPKAKGGHTFKDLVGSDHVELKVTDGSGALALHFKLDYISEDASSACGYHNLGVTGGEGKMIVGSASSVLATSTSLDRDLNGCGYCYTVDSPATDENYTPNPATPKWDYRVVYEAWLDPAAFGAAGFGEAIVESVHASPSKLDSNTVEVVKKPCPPDWDVPYCPPGASCTGGTGGSYGQCPPGYVPDLASEGKFCVPG